MFYPVTVFPEVWLLSHWNESPRVRKSHQVIKYLSSWGSPGTAQTSPFGEGTPGPPQGGHPPPHQSCPYVVLLITAVKRQNHPCPEHRQQWNNGGGGGGEGWPWSNCAIWPEGGKGQSHLSSTSSLPPQQPCAKHPVWRQSLRGIRESFQTLGSVGGPRRGGHISDSKSHHCEN